MYVSGRALHAQAVFLIKSFSCCSLPKSMLDWKRLNRCNTFAPGDVREQLYQPNRWADLIASKFGMTSKVYHVKPDAIRTLQSCKNALILHKAITETRNKNTRSELLPAPAFCCWLFFLQSGGEPDVEACFGNYFKDEIGCLLCLRVSSAGKLQSGRREKMRTTTGWKMNLLWICPCVCIWLGSGFQPCCDSYFKGTMIPSHITGAGRAADLASELPGMSYPSQSIWNRSKW